MGRKSLLEEDPARNEQACHMGTEGLSRQLEAPFWGTMVGFKTNE